MSGYTGPDRPAPAPAPSAAVLYTTEDRALLREMHDELVGTFEKKGLLRVVEDHVKWNHEDPRGVAKEEIDKHVERAGHVADRRDSGAYGLNWRRWLFGFTQAIAIAASLALGTWVVAVFLLGLSVTIWQNAP